jgi:molecular chaperone DnaJ
LPGADLCYHLELSHEEAVMGVKKTIQVSTRMTCPQCRGNGAKSTSEVQICPWCRGSGRYSETSTVFAATGVCAKCKGKGSGRLVACNSCDGQGRREVKKELVVNIPAGIESNTRLKILREGDDGEVNSESGDLYVLLKVR